MSKYKIDYARVSTLQQDEALQHDALLAAGCQRIFVDKASEKLGSRPALDDLLEQARPGDTVVVWRLGRSLRQLIDVIQGLQQREVAFVGFTEQRDNPPPGPADLPRLRCVGRARPHPRADEFGLPVQQSPIDPAQVGLAAGWRRGSTALESAVITRLRPGRVTAVDGPLRRQGGGQGPRPAWRRQQDHRCPTLDPALAIGRRAPSRTAATNLQVSAP